METDQMKNKEMLLKEYESLLALKEDYPKGIKGYEMDDEIYRLSLSSIKHDVRVMAEKMVEEKSPRKITHVKNNVANAAERVWTIQAYYGDDAIEIIAIISKIASFALLIAGMNAKEPQMQSILLWSVVPTLFLPGMFAISVGMSIEIVATFIEKHTRVDFNSQRDAIYQDIAKAFNKYVKNKDSEQFKNSVTNLLHDDQEKEDGGFTKWWK